MKLEDVFVGQRVGFPYEGKSVVGVITNIENVPKDDEDRWIATVENGNMIWDVNIKRLLGVVGTGVVSETGVVGTGIVK